MRCVMNILRPFRLVDRARADCARCVMCVYPVRVRGVRGTDLQSGRHMHVHDVHVCCVVVCVCCVCVRV